MLQDGICRVGTNAAMFSQPAKERLKRRDAPGQALGAAGNVSTAPAFQPLDKVRQVSGSDITDSFIRRKIFRKQSQITPEGFNCVLWTTLIQ